jgi:hypothetical protein
LATTLFEVERFSTKVLVMPYFKPVTECGDLVSRGALTREAIESAARSAVKRMAGVGLRHDDIQGKWFHVGLFYNKTGKLDGVLTCGADFRL